jgi:hypothetical protein
MKHVHFTTITTQDHTPAPLTVAEASKALGRSRSWVRDRIADGRLTVQAEKPVVAVTWASFVQLKGRLRADDLARARRAPHLRLVVSNA